MFNLGSILTDLNPAAGVVIWVSRPSSDLAPYASLFLGIIALHVFAKESGYCGCDKAFKVCAPGFCCLL